MDFEKKDAEEEISIPQRVQLENGIMVKLGVRNGVYGIGFHVGDVGDGFSKSEQKDVETAARKVGGLGTLIGDGDVGTDLEKAKTAFDEIVKLAEQANPKDPADLDMLLKKIKELGEK